MFPIVHYSLHCRIIDSNKQPIIFAVYIIFVKAEVCLVVKPSINSLQKTDFGMVMVKQAKEQNANMCMRSSSDPNLGDNVLMKVVQGTKYMMYARVWGTMNLEIEAWGIEMRFLARIEDLIC